MGCRNRSDPASPHFPKVRKIPPDARPQSSSLTDRGVGPTFLSDIFTWLAFFAITAVAGYSVCGLIQDVFPPKSHLISSEAD
jgi:hypothetical protein